VLSDDVVDYPLQDQFLLVVFKLGLTEVDIDGCGDDHITADVGLTGIKSSNEAVLMINQHFLDGIF
jgi:hypothetical protein